jgi:hypothetical protein
VENGNRDSGRMEGKMGLFPIGDHTFTIGGNYDTTLGGYQGTH